jgi:hypothetical protein
MRTFNKKLTLISLRSLCSHFGYPQFLFSLSSMVLHSAKDVCRLMHEIEGRLASAPYRLPCKIKNALAPVNRGSQIALHCGSPPSK